ncbi:MAG: LysR family transcriptional regulator, partial [Myxococcota bacterium]
VAAPSLIERVGRPEHPRELTSLPCLLYAYQAKPNVWIFDDDGERLEVQIDGPLRVNNDDFAVEAAVRGFGFT